MSLNNLGLGFVFTATDRASGAIGRVGTQFDRTAGRARLGSGIMRAGLIGIGSAAAATAVGVGTLMGAFSLAGVAGEFGQTMARVGALTRATAGDMELLRGRAIEAGIATQFSPREAAEGLAELGVRGLNANEAMTALSGSLDLAAGGQITVARSSATLAAALRVFSIQADGAGLVTDQLLRISNVTALQAGDLEIALGNVSRGAGVAQQSIEEMLPAIGLVKNTGVEASSAATGVSTALIRMSQRATDFRALGVEVTNAAGEFRPFLDVVRETDVALSGQFTDAAERAAKATELFGVRGLGAFQAIANQLNGQIRDTEGNTLNAAEAIDHLRDSMVGAGGAAAEFRERMLDTFEGQKTLLSGTVETLQTVTGESFSKVFRPFVEAVTNTLNAFIRVWTGLPEPIRTAVAAVVVALGGLLTVFGSATVFAFTLAIIIPFLKIIAITLGIVALALLPVIAGMAALVASVAIFGVAVRRNIGGIGDFFEEKFGQIRLAWEGVQQLFTDGGFSGAVREEMGRAENQGIREFVINVFALGFRLQRFFGGMMEGIRLGLDQAAPSFESFMAALRELGRAFGFVSTTADEMAGSNSNEFFLNGARLGKLLARAAEFVVDVFTGLIRLTSGLVKTIRVGFVLLGPLFGSLSKAVGDLSLAFGDLTGQGAEMTKGAKETGGAMTVVGRVIGGFVVGAVGAAVFMLRNLLRVLTLVTGAIAGFVHAGRTGFRLFGDAVDAYAVTFVNFGDQVTATVSGILADTLRLVRSLPAPVRAGLGIGDTGGTEQALLGQQRLARDRISVRNAQQGLRAAERLPAGAERDRATASAQSIQGDAVRTLLREMGQQPVQVQAVLQVDSETIARATANGKRSSDAGGFRSPVALGPED